MTTQNTWAYHRPLLNAIECGAYCRAVELLKVDNTFSQDELDNALIAACQHGHIFLAQKLARFGANVQYKDTNGNTPLLISARNCFIDIVRFLIMKKADVNVCDSNGNTALILSIRSSGSTEIVKVLLSQEGININHQNKDGYTALMKAVENMDIDTVKLILDKYAELSGKSYIRNSRLFQMQINWNKIDKSVNFKGQNAQQIAEQLGLGTIFKILKNNRDSSLPLITAFNTGDTDTFNILLDSQFLYTTDMIRSVKATFSNIVDNYKRDNMKTINDNEISMIMRFLEFGVETHYNYYLNDISNLFFVAINLGQYKLVELLCKHLDQAKLQHYHTNIQALALIEAAKIGRCDLIELLLRYNTYIKTPNFSNSPLDCALSNGHIDCAKVLIKHGAKVDVKYALKLAVDKQMKYMDFLFENCRQDISNYFKTNASCLNQLLISAVINGNLEIIGHILDAGADVNGSDYSGETPLMKSKDEDVALYLIRRGANVNLVTPFLSVMMDSCGYDCSKIGVLRVLIEHGAFSNARSCYGETPLILAASKENFECILQILSCCGANFCDQDDEGNTAFIKAVRCGNLQNVLNLFQFAKNKNDFLNIQNHKGLSALMCAVTQEKLKMVQELIDHGADVNLKDMNGNTTLLHAITNITEQREEIMITLIKAGSHINCQNNFGVSPLMLAVRKCLKDSMSILLDSGADVNAVSMKYNTKTAISLLTRDVYVSKIEVLCIETLLERGANASYVQPDFLHRMIIQGETSVILKLIKCGLAPADIKLKGMVTGDYGTISTVSPLCVALLVGNVSLAKYLFGNLFLTNCDMSLLTWNKVIRYTVVKKQKECVNFLNEISSQPFSLLQLSFVSVSSAVGPSLGRENRVNLLPLPQVIKDKLLFKLEVVTLNILSESNVEQSNFSELNFRTDPYKVFFDYDFVTYDNDSDDDDYDYWTTSCKDLDYGDCDSD